MPQCGPKRQKENERKKERGGRGGERKGGRKRKRKKKYTQVHDLDDGNYGPTPFQLLTLI